MKIKILILLIIPFTVCGCFNYNELESVSICTAMTIDLEEDEYKVSYMIANARKNDASSKEGEAQSVVYSGTGKTISEAIDDLEDTIPRVPYIAHLETIIISEEVAKSGLENILDFLLRNPESRKKFLIYLTKDSKAEDVIKILSPLESFPSTNVLENLKTSSKYQSKAIQIEYNKFISILLEEGIEPILSSVEVIGDVEKGGEAESLDKTYLTALLKNGTIGLFKEDKLITFADEEETIGINFIKNAVYELIIPIPCGNSDIILNTESSKTKVDIDFKEDKPIIKIKVNTNAVLGEVNCKVNLNDNNNLDKIAEDGKKAIQEYINKALVLAKEEKTDIFGFGALIHKNYPKKWKNLKENWNESGFTNLEVEVDIKLNMKGTGSLMQTMEELK